jgi:hypothetical protein
MEAPVARQLSGGGHGERPGRGEEATRWRWTRQTDPGEECGVEEAARGGSVEEAAGDRARCCGGLVAARRSGVGGWAWRHREETIHRASGRADEMSG